MNGTWIPDGPGPPAVARRLADPRPLAAVLIGVAALLPAGPVTAGIPQGTAIVLGFHCVQPPDAGAIPWLGSPDELVPFAKESGPCEVWLFLFTRSPLIGAWTVTAGVSYAGAEAPGRGLTVTGWTSFTDSFRAGAGWPLPGTAFRAGWRRERCRNPDLYMDPGRDGWWVQRVLKLEAEVGGNDLLSFCQPEPGVVPQLIECADEMHELDGTDSWTRVIPAVFGPEAAPSSGGEAIASSSKPATWSSVKAPERKTEW
jgi:hypothetical protein